MTAPAEFPNGIQIGNVLLEAVLSQHRDPNGRLRIKGLKGNGAELQLEPADDFKGPGVAAQILMFAPPRPGEDDSVARFCLSIVRESNNPDGSQGPDKVMIDMDAHEGRKAGSLPVFVMTGGITKKDGKEIRGKLVMQISGDGTIEAWDERSGKRLRFDIAEKLAALP